MIELKVAPEIHKAACVIAVQCRRVIQTCLRDEEIADCDRAFYDIAVETMRELAALRGE